jgi:integrase
MADKVRLTAGRIRDFSCKNGKSQDFLWDTDVPGLAIRATQPGKRSPNGSKAYIFQGRLGSGNSVRMTIGDHRHWDIDKAREEARSLQKLIDKGIDPRQAKTSNLIEAEVNRQTDERRNVTFNSAFSAYLNARKSKWSTRHYSDHEKAISSKGTPGPLSSLASLPLSDLTPDHVKEWLDDPKQVARPTYTAIAFRKLRAFINWLSDQNEYSGIAAADSCSRKVAIDRIAKNKSKDDCLQREQVKPWFIAVGALSNPVVSAYLQALLLTGTRREELATLRWENVDLKWKTLLIKDKVDGERTIPLTPYVEKLIRQLKTLNDTPPQEYRILHGKRINNDLENWKPSEWVFSSKTASSGRIVEPRIGHNRALIAAGLPALTLHGLRRSFGTLAEWVECPVGISAQIMGHKPSALAEKHYRVRPIDLLRMWHTKIEAWILEQAEIKQPTIE